MRSSQSRGIANHALPLRRKLHDAVTLQMLQHPQAGADHVRTLRGLPVEMLAVRLAQLAAGVAGKRGDGLLDFGILPAAQAPPGEARRLQLQPPRLQRRAGHASS